MNINKIADQLEQVGYIVLEKPLLGKLSGQLLARCQHDDLGRFQPAKIGRGLAKQHNDTIRSDSICWLDNANSADHAYLAWMETLRMGLNSLLYLGLFDFESHYAIYGAGTSYAKHSDILSGNQNRILSTVLYLNEDWKDQDGGKLLLFERTGNTVIAQINPTFGRMIIFLSGSFPHEVLVAHTQRRSVAGWFRGR